jgi:hypothetical protein
LAEVGGIFKVERSCQSSSEQAKDAESDDEEEKPKDTDDDEMRTGTRQDTSDDMHGENGCRSDGGFSCEHNWNCGPP